MEADEQSKAKTDKKAARTYLATSALLNVICVVFIPLGQFVTHASFATRRITFLAFVGFSVFAFVSLGRSSWRDKQLRMLTFIFASGVALIIVAWICIWPNATHNKVFETAASAVSHIFSVLGELGRSARKLGGYAILLLLCIGYLLLFSPTMIAVLYSQPWTRTTDRFSGKLAQITRRDVE